MGAVLSQNSKVGLRNGIRDIATALKWIRRWFGDAKFDVQFNGSGLIS